MSKPITITATIFILIIVATFIGYSPIKPKPVERQQVPMWERLSTEENKNLASCLAQADLGYTLSWNKQCEMSGLTKECSLDKSRAQIQNQYYQEQINKCYRTLNVESRAYDNLYKN